MDALSFHIIYPPISVYIHMHSHDTPSLCHPHLSLLHTSLPPSPHILCCPISITAAMDGDGSIDAIDLYSMDEYLQEQEIIDDLGDHLVAGMQSIADGLQGGRAQRGHIGGMWTDHVKKLGRG